MDQESIKNSRFSWFPCCRGKGTITLLFQGESTGNHTGMLPHAESKELALKWAKHRNRHLSKEDIQMVNKHMKRSLITGEM